MLARELSPLCVGERRDPLGTGPCPPLLCRSLPGRWWRELPWVPDVPEFGFCLPHPVVPSGP